MNYRLLVRCVVSPIVMQRFMILVSCMVGRFAQSLFLCGWSKNVSHETFSAPIFLRFSEFSVLATLLGGWTIQGKCLLSAQPIDFQGFDFAPRVFSSFPPFLGDFLSLIVTINFFSGYLAKNFKKILIFTTKKLEM